MLKTREGSDLMAELLGISPTANHYLVRGLRLAGRNDWPAIGSGRREGGVRTHHLINNLIGHSCCFGQPSDAPRLVQEFNLLRPKSFTLRRPAEDMPDTFVETTFPATSSHREPLAYVFRDLIRSAAQDMTGWLDELGIREIVEKDWPSIRIVLGAAEEPMTANVVRHRNPREGLTCHYEVDPDILPGRNLPVRQKAYRAEIVFDRDEIYALTAVALQTGDFDDLVTRQIVPSEPTPESKTAAPDLAKDQNAAALGDQPAKTELDGSAQRHLAGVSEKTQLGSKSRAGRSRHPDRNVKHDIAQHEHHAAA